MKQRAVVLACACALASCGSESPPRPPQDGLQKSGGTSASSPALPPSTRETLPGDNDSASYIRRVFSSQIGELPRLGWIAGAEQFLASERFPTIAIYGPIGSPSSAAFQTTITGEEQVATRKKHGIACEEPDTGLASYGLNYRGDLARQNRALFTARPFPNYESTELVRRPLTSRELANSSDVLGWPAPALRRAEAVSIAGDSAYYSIHQLFAQDSTLVKEALLLHDRNGAVVAFELRDHDNTELCDGCALPTYNDGVGYDYHVENVLRLDGFVYPILLLDTGTMEGRALSLLTFTPTRRISEFRVYEYVVNCDRARAGEAAGSS